MKQSFLSLSISISVLSLWTSCSEAPPPPQGQKPAPQVQETKPTLPPKPKIDVNFPSSPFSHNFVEPASLAQATYQVPEEAQLKAKAQPLANKQINTSKMERWYTPSTSSNMDIPIPMGSTSLNKEKPTRSQYWELYYQGGRLRQAFLHQNGNKQPKIKVFYNQDGAPAVIFEYTGQAYTIYLLEYDQKGHLARRIKWNTLGKLQNVTLFTCRDGYNDFDLYSFEADGKLSAKLTYNETNGSFVYKPNQPPKKLKQGMLQKIKGLEQYGLAPVFPLNSER